MRYFVTFVLAYVCPSRRLDVPRAVGGRSRHPRSAARRLTDASRKPLRESAARVHDGRRKPAGGPTLNFKRAQEDRAEDAWKPSPEAPRKPLRELPARAQESGTKPAGDSESQLETRAGRRHEGVRKPLPEDPQNIAGSQMRAWYRSALTTPGRPPSKTAIEDGSLKPVEGRRRPAA